MYAVETVVEALEQIAALPHEVLPWTSDSYNRQRPEANMRARPFGPHHQGLVIYLILEDQRRVVVLRVLRLE